MSQTIILLIDDHAMFRAGLRMIIESDLADVHIFEASSLNEVFHGSLNVPAVAFTPGIVLLDLNLPDNKKMSLENGLYGIDSLKKKWPQTPILVLSSQDDQETVRTVLKLGASVFVSKAESAKIIIESIQYALNQDTSHIQPNACYTNKTEQITPRQSEVLQLLCRGLTNKIIARQLKLSENTVRVHVQALLKFFHASNRAEVAFAARHLSPID
jgi:DNA-binding NarL/FixJ family response regulator